MPPIDPPNPEPAAAAAAVAAIEPPAPAAPEPAAAAPAPEPAPAPVEPAAAPAEPAVADPAAKAPEPEKPALAADEPTLLELAGEKPPEPKPEDAKPGDPPKDGEKAPEAAPPLEPIAYDLKVPENVTLQPEKLGEFTTFLREKAIAPEIGQDLLNRHTEAMVAYDGKLRSDQQRAFMDYRADQRTKIMADPELGGAGHNTAKMAVAEMRDMFVSSAPRGSERYNAEMKEFNEFLTYTGAGDHPALWRMLNNVARRFKEPAPLPSDFRPPPDIGINPKKGRAGSMYDHPTSSAKAR